MCAIRFEDFVDNIDELAKRPLPAFCFLDDPFSWPGATICAEELSWGSGVGETKAKDPHKLRLTSYRVLVTRGRDGMVIFVPPDDQVMASTLEVLQNRRQQSSGDESRYVGAALPSI